MSPDHVEFWVYENWRARGHKAIVHRATCNFCKGGRGLLGGTRADNGRWLGPFKTSVHAQSVAGGTGAYVIVHMCV